MALVFSLKPEKGCQHGGQDSCVASVSSWLHAHGRLRNASAWMALVLLAVALPAHEPAIAAENWYVREDSVACSTERLLDEAREAIAARDDGWISRIRGCYIIKAFTGVRVVDVQMFGYTKVELRIRGQRPIPLYLDQSHLRREK